MFGHRKRVRKWNDFLVPWLSNEQGTKGLYVIREGKTLTFQRKEVFRDMHEHIWQVLCIFRNVEPDGIDHEIVCNRLPWPMWFIYCLVESCRHLFKKVI